MRYIGQKLWLLVIENLCYYDINEMKCPCNLRAARGICDFSCTEIINWNKNIET
jgi:hypothetical protein